MRSYIMHPLKYCVLALLVFSCSLTRADEGMWLLDALPRLPLDSMRQHGLSLTPEQICGLKEGVVLLSGGTASFVSPQGLLLTNHHVAYGAIQSLSSVDADYIQDGFHATTRDEELPTSYTLDIVVAIQDVTDQVRSDVHDGMAQDEQLRAIRSRILDIEEAEPDTGGYTSKVVAMYEANRHYLFRLKRLSDIRLVYAPPSSIGNFGGEVDNWIWPRHTGDFTLMRAYVGPDGRPASYSRDNIPYRATVFFPISTRGVDEGSFAMIMGFPGRTYRYQEASAVQLAIDETIPTTIDLYKTRIDVIERTTRSDRSKEIQYASKVRRLSNTYKKYLAILDGFRRSDILKIKQTTERAFQAYVDSSPTLATTSSSLLHKLKAASDDLRKCDRKNLFLSSLTRGVELVSVASRFNTYANSFPQDSLGNILEPSDGQREGMKSYVKGAFKDLDTGIDRELLIALLLKSFTLDATQQPGFASEVARGDTGVQRDENVREFVENLYRSTKLATPAGCEQLLTKGRGEIFDDPYVRFARQVSSERTAVEAEVYRANTTLDNLRSKFVAAWMNWKNGGGACYPDANRTLRLTYGQVQPLSPRDAVHYSHITTLTGVIEKETGEPPFVVPQKLRDLWKHKDFGRYADPLLRDVPVGFIADMDITGGNSGSPVINGRGELIGCAFDTNWDGVTGDYLFEEKYNRVISVDARYVLFILDKFSGAQNILQELDIH